MNIQPAPPAQALHAAGAAPLAQWEIDANALHLQGEHRQLYQLLPEFHNFNRGQCAKLREEEYSPLSDLVNWKFQEICSLLKDLSNRPSTGAASIVLVHH